MIKRAQSNLETSKTLRSKLMPLGSSSGYESRDDESESESEEDEDNTEIVEEIQDKSTKAPRKLSQIAEGKLHVPQPEFNLNNMASPEIMPTSPSMFELATGIKFSSNCL